MAELCANNREHVQWQCLCATNLCLHQLLQASTRKGADDLNQCPTWLRKKESKSSAQGGETEARGRDTCETMLLNDEGTVNGLLDRTVSE
jgi:hypothetical protein